MTRHSFRFQFQQRAINDRLRIGLTGAATLTDMQMPFSDDYILAYNMLPVYPVYNADALISRMPTTIMIKVTRFRTKIRTIRKQLITTSMDKVMYSSLFWMD